MRTALVSGFWGQNVGNAFFNLAGRHCLEAAGHDVSFIQDQPAYWTFRDESKGNYSNSKSLLDVVDCELVVLQGPLFTRNFLNIWKPTLVALRRAGRQWAILSGGLRSYSPEEIAIAKEAFAVHPPLFVSTRDRATADALRPFYPKVRSGIDSAFFIPKSENVLKLSGPRSVALCFDHFLEPKRIDHANGMFQLNNVKFDLEFSGHLDRLASRSKAHAYVAQVLDRRAKPTEWAGLQVIRPEHRTNPHLPWKIYRQPNAVASDEPWSYLSVYRSVEATLSDRVHACVATLAYGGQAYLHNPTTKRSALFDAVGAGSVTRELTSVSLERLDSEYGAVTQFLAEHV